MINTSVNQTGHARSSDRYEPLSPWMYFGLSLLFYVPIIGIIFMVIYSFDESNINRRNFARSYFCMFVLTVIVGVILGIIGATTGLFTTLMTRLMP